MNPVNIRRQLQIYQDKGVPDFLVNLAKEKLEIRKEMKRVIEENPGGYILVFPSKYISLVELIRLAFDEVVEEYDEGIDQGRTRDLPLTPEDIYLIRRPQFLFDIPKPPFFKSLTLRELITVSIIYGDSTPFKDTFAIQALGSRYCPRGDDLKDEIFIPVLSSYGITPIAKRLYDLWYSLSFAHISFGFCYSRLEV
ncbi:MAG: hypothetical protein ACQESA_02955 [Patescibacteria group bacterium]